MILRETNDLFRKKHVQHHKLMREVAGHVFLKKIETWVKLAKLLMIVPKGPGKAPLSLLRF